ncbi:hypothetical protein G6F57_022782 [Rhizopus arrhizus]|jgi:hypothetical protein|nr:hypothetical protein G6F59_018885 [Rhizopus arrhizus]KAG1432701.1 hypothetical protein G6F57_022782 [Rhizopus arrhizus]
MGRLGKLQSGAYILSGAAATVSAAGCAGSSGSEMPASAVAAIRRDDVLLAKAKDKVRAYCVVDKRTPGPRAIE